MSIVIIIIIIIIIIILSKHNHVSRISFVFTIVNFTVITNQPNLKVKAFMQCTIMQCGAVGELY
jgi:hypothetical protein